jgi:hypothetical protein
LIELYLYRILFIILYIYIEYPFLLTQK